MMVWGEDFAIDTDDIMYIRAMNTPVLPTIRARIALRDNKSIDTKMSFEAVRDLIGEWGES